VICSGDSFSLCRDHITASIIEETPFHEVSRFVYMYKLFFSQDFYASLIIMIIILIAARCSYTEAHITSVS